MGIDTQPRRPNMIWITPIHLKSSLAPDDQTKNRGSILMEVKIPRRRGYYEKYSCYFPLMKGAGLVDIPWDVTYSTSMSIWIKSPKVYDYFDKEIRKELKTLEKGEQLSVIPVRWSKRIEFGHFKSYCSNSPQEPCMIRDSSTTKSEIYGVSQCQNWQVKKRFWMWHHLY